MADWREDVVNYLQVVSILSAGAFAALALFTNYKEDGKVTRYGRFAVTGIVLSLLCSLGTRWAQSDLDRDRSQAASIRAEGQRQAENVRFRGQLATLVGLSNLQRQSLLAQQRSLGDQQRLLAQASATILEIQNARSQEDRNTSRTLRMMWADANRVETTGIRVTAAYYCTTRDGRTLSPLFPDRAMAIVGMTGADQRLPGFGDHMNFTTDTQPGATRAIAYAPRTSVRGTGNRVYHFVDFGSFTSDAWNPFLNPDHWRNAGIEVIVQTRAEVTEADLVQSIGPMAGMDEIGSVYDFGPALRNELRQVAVLPCMAKLFVSINGRQILEQNAHLLYLTDAEEGGSFILMRSYPQRVPSDVFPQFDGRR